MAKAEGPDKSAGYCQAPRLNVIQMFISKQLRMFYGSATMNALPAWGMLLFDP
jgi:hypothetical protein